LQGGEHNKNKKYKLPRDIKQHHTRKSGNPPQAHEKAASKLLNLFTLSGKLKCSSWS